MIFLYCCVVHLKTSKSIFHLGIELFFFGVEHMESEEHLRKMLPPEVVAQQPE